MLRYMVIYIKLIFFVWLFVQITSCTSPQVIQIATQIIQNTIPNHFTMAPYLGWHCKVTNKIFNSPFNNEGVTGQLVNW